MPLTLADYAAAKGLPIDFLASLGVSEETTRNGPRLRIRTKTRMAERSSCASVTSSRAKAFRGRKEAPAGLSSTD